MLSKSLAKSHNVLMGWQLSLEVLSSFLKTGLFLVLSVKKGFIVFQKCLFSTLRLLKWRVLDSFERFEQLFRCCLQLDQFLTFLSLLNSFFNFDLFIIVGLIVTLRSETIFGNSKPFKNDEKHFLFHLRSSFCSQYIV